MHVLVKTYTYITRYTYNNGENNYMQQQNHKQPLIL